ncbi:hypothetical protein CDAR_187711 [Caerostris darwini]|uniref:Uncharacterized protein n=1 Tax=Caerostris darwini TaxID=1538125 RepID=A0AAV4RHU0_9ARAC|nr:hypothetical protein CDAR_580821 [Caerostris darwini]GIY52650.1 hypothetical protein CDAR_187711 [Caerostris darwini]
MDGGGVFLPSTTRMSDNDFNFRIIPSPSRLAGFRKINRPLDRDYATGICSLSPKNLKTTDGLQKQYSSTMIAPPWRKISAIRKPPTT